MYIPNAGAGQQFPDLDPWTLEAGLAEGCRAAAAERKAGLADVERAFGKRLAGDRAPLFCNDKVHLGKAGHESAAATVLEVIERAGK